MHTVASIIDIHARCHRSIAALLDHCREFEAGELQRELPGFGHATVHAQLHHALGAERYWVGVLERRIIIDDDAEAYPTIADLERMRVEVFAATEAFLAGCDEAGLNAPRPVRTWRGDELLLAPAPVVLRTQTHLFHHQGQVAVMCRLLGRPVAGCDLPID